MVRFVRIGRETEEAQKTNDLRIQVCFDDDIVSIDTIFLRTDGIRAGSENKSFEGKGSAVSHTGKLRIPTFSKGPSVALTSKVG
jgi:hypothetical protein